MAEPRKPDRFDKQARDLADKLFKVPAFDSELMEIAAALRQAEASALERAARIADNEACQLDEGDQYIKAAHRIADKTRALIPPAAAHVPVKCQRCNGHGSVPDYATASIRTDTLPPTIPCPDCQPAHAAETRCPFDEQDCLDARQLLRECEDALSTVGCHPDGEALAQAVLKKLRARAAPPKEEGT